MTRDGAVLELEGVRRVVAGMAAQVGGSLWPNGLGYSVAGSFEGVEGEWEVFGGKLEFGGGWITSFFREGDREAFAFGEGCGGVLQSMDSAVRRAG
jgi:hypothetical protein